MASSKEYLDFILEQLSELEEISYRQGWISKEQVIELAKPLMKTGYGKYLMDIIE